MTYMACGATALAVLFAAVAVAVPEVEGRAVFQLMAVPLTFFAGAEGPSGDPVFTPPHEIASVTVLRPRVTK